MKINLSVVKAVGPLGFPWETQDPFLFCVYHADDYPRGNEDFGPDTSLAGRNMGNDFVVKNGFRMYHGTRVPGFPVHPHRGFETVTVVRKGIVDHSDSLGGAGRYGNGDVQWMTAGKGIQHSEMFPLLDRENGNPLELFQIWLNLPKADKFVNPHYSMLWGEKIPVIHLEDQNGLKTTIELVAGNLGNRLSLNPAPSSWAANRDHEVGIWIVEMEPGAKWSLPPASKGVNRSFYFFEGVSLVINESSYDTNCVIELQAHMETQLENGSTKGRFLILQGAPINEPVVSYGPFVMNTREEIQQTYAEYQKTRFGGWPWPKDDQVHGRVQGRFARYTDGTEELPPSKG